MIYDLTFATRRAKLTGVERYAIRMHQAASTRSDRVWALAADPTLLKTQSRVVDTGSFGASWLTLARFVPRRMWRRSILICPCVPVSPSLLGSGLPIARIIHDEFAWTRSGDLSRAGRLLFRDYERLVLGANSLLFAPTELARAALQRVLNRSDIHCAGNATGIVLDGEAEAPAASLEPNDFILCVGTIEPRKNYDAILDLVANGPTNLPPVVIVGRRGWGAIAEKLDVAIARSGSQLRWLESASDSNLRWLYRHCRLFISLSHAEGFNMPLVEAGSFGAPILCSDLPIHRAVAAPWARFISASEAASEIGVFLAGESRRPSQAEVGRYRDRFSWEAVARNVEEPLSELWRAAL